MPSLPCSKLATNLQINAWATAQHQPYSTTELSFFASQRPFELFVQSWSRPQKARLRCLLPFDFRRRQAPFPPTPHPFPARSLLIFCRLPPVPPQQLGDTLLAAVKVAKETRSGTSSARLLRLQACLQGVLTLFHHHHCTVVSLLPSLSPSSQPAKQPACGSLLTRIRARCGAALRHYGDKTISSERYVLAAWARTSAPSR